MERTSVFLFRTAEDGLRYQQFTQGAAQDNLSQKKLLSIKFPVPDVTVQERVADLISTYDDLIENNWRRIALLEESARLLYKEWFVHLRFPGHEHVKVVDGVPEGWERKALSEIAESITYGYTASSSPDPIGPKLLRITDIVPCTIDWDGVPFCEAEESVVAKYRLTEGDIVVARTGATVGYAKRIGKIQCDAIYASYLVRLRFGDALDNIIAGIFIESDEYKSFIKNHAGGAAQPNASAKVLSRATLLVAPKTLQQEFRENVEPINSQRENLQQQNQKLAEARDLLLPRLMNGEIEV